MTLVRQNEREVVLQCDGCVEGVFYADTTEIADARLMAEAHGWMHGRDDDDEITDYCTKCAPKDLWRT